MVEKYVAAPGNSDSQTIVELTTKVNEVVELIGRQQLRQRPMTQPLSQKQQAEQLSMMVQRLIDMPMKQITAGGESAQTKTVAAALAHVQIALIDYKESLG